MHLGRKSVCLSCYLTDWLLIFFRDTSILQLKSFSDGRATSEQPPPPPPFPHTFLTSELGGGLHPTEFLKLRLWLTWRQSGSLLGCLADCLTVWLFASLAGRLVYILPANFFFLPVCLPTICLPHCFLLMEKEAVAPVNMPLLTNTVMQTSSAPISNKYLTLVSPVAWSWSLSHILTQHH